ncbi:hypothetical protein O988_01575 [Pseudogymnoascus sp. VKM F-3808]|nr:hypothetical protein O988_01575 [Pseudogymnoascus sp. VKM F-3808]
MELCLAGLFFLVRDADGNATCTAQAITMSVTMAFTALFQFSSDYQAVNDIHDILKAYYRVALKRYMDNVVLQVIERIYLGSNGPVRAVSPGYVGTLSDTELANIAAESYATSSTRTEIGYKLQRLDEASNLAETLPI